MAKAFNACLKNFLETGNPNGDELDKWSAWDSSTKESMIFDATESNAAIAQKDVSTTYDDILAAMDADTTVSDDVKLLVEQNDMAGRWFYAANDAHCGAPNLWLTAYEA